jgi:uncharacterized Fe-S cluster-containing protein
MCWKEIVNHNWLKKFCSACRKKRDDELQKENVEKQKKRVRI